MTRELGAGDVPLPLNYCVTNFNPLSGVAQAIVDKGRLSEWKPFRTFNVRLWHLDVAFGGYTKGWNRDYEAAQKIYGRGPSSKLVRAGLRTQNFMAYSNDYVNNFSKVYKVLGMASLSEMLRQYSDIDQSKKTVPEGPSTTRYTYVIMPDSHLHFSVTSKQLATDFLSKHALHAGAATEVVYAGEFFFDRFSKRAEETGKVALVIDNNSGTFAPPKERLDSLKLLMQLNFGTDMPIFALDRESSLLKELFDANGVE